MSTGPQSTSGHPSARASADRLPSGVEPPESATPDGNVAAYGRSELKRVCVSRAVLGHRFEYLDLRYVVSMIACLWLTVDDCSSPILASGMMVT